MSVQGTNDVWLVLDAAGAEEVVSGACVPQALVALVAGKIFDFVKGDYGDGHVHCDMRSFVGR